MEWRISGKGGMIWWWAEKWVKSSIMKLWCYLQSLDTFWGDKVLTLRLNDWVKAKAGKDEVTAGIRKAEKLWHIRQHYHGWSGADQGVPNGGGALVCQARGGWDEEGKTQCWFIWLFKVLTHYLGKVCKAVPTKVCQDIGEKCTPPSCDYSVSWNLLNSFLIKLVMGVLCIAPHHPGTF